jgi:hypothetical protein
MNQTRRLMNWPDLLVYCTIGLCVGIISGLLLPFTPIARTGLLNVFASQPGQIGAIGGVVGILICALFFFYKSAATEYEKTARVTSMQATFITDAQEVGTGTHTIGIISAILIFTVVIQVILVKSWT